MDPRCTMDLYHSACRLCLSKGVTTLPIFRDRDDGLTSISARIQAYLSVEVCQSDDLPQQICHRCECQVNLWHYFKIECDSAQAELRKWITNIRKEKDSEKVRAELEHLREVVDVKLEPEDDIVEEESCIITSVISREFRKDGPRNGSKDIHSNATVQLEAELQERDLNQLTVSPRSAKDSKRSLVRSESINLVISDTSSVAVNNVEEPSLIPRHSELALDMNEDQGLLRLPSEDIVDNVSDGIENDDAHLVEDVDDEMEDVDVTFLSDEAPESPIQRILEVNLEDSNDAAKSPSPAEGIVGVDTLGDETQSEIRDPLESTEESTSILEVPLRIVKKEPYEPVEQFRDLLKIKQEPEDPVGSGSNSAVSLLKNFISRAKAADVEKQAVPSTKSRPSVSFKHSQSLKSPRAYRCSKCTATFHAPWLLHNHGLEHAQQDTPYHSDDDSASVVQTESTATSLSPTDLVYNFSAVKLPSVTNEIYDEENSYCKLCDKRFTKQNFWRHIKNMHLKDNPFKCGGCRNVFQGRRELVSHRVRTVSKYCREGRTPETDMSCIITHPKVGRGQMGRYECKECNTKFRQLSHAKIHVRLHSGEKPFFCYKCNDKEFRLKKAALKHLLRCDGSKRDGPSFAPKGKVKLLPTKISNPPILKVSLPTSSKEKIKRVCAKCGKTFANGIGFANHLRHECVRKCLSCSKLIARKLFKKHCLHCAKGNSSAAVAPTPSIPTSAHKSKPVKIATPTTIQTSAHKSKPVKTDTPTKTSSKSASVTPVVNVPVKELEAMHYDSHGRLTTMVCKLCNRVMGSRKSLQAHLLKHSSKAFRCHMCNLRMRLKSTYDSHMANFHDGFASASEAGSSQVAVPTPKLGVKSGTFKNMKLKCEVCFKPFSSTTSLNFHRQSHKRVKCKVCEITFPASMENSHICTPKIKTEAVIKQERSENVSQDLNKEEIKAVQYTCHLCKKKFHTRKMLYQHKKMHIKMKIYKCKLCGNSYSDANALQEHKQTVHPHEIIEQDKQPEAGSSNEPSTSGQLRSLLSTHRPWKCTLCNKSYSTRDHLRRHIKAHPTAKPSTPTVVLPACPWQCTKCFKRYSSRDALNRHKKLHVAGTTLIVGGVATAIHKPNQPGVLFCSLCSRAFESNASFIRHKGWHSRDQGTEAPVPEGTDQKALPVISEISQKPANHPKTAVTSKENTPLRMLTPVVSLRDILPQNKSIYKCKSCPKSFLSYFSLSAHMRVHSAAKTHSKESKKTGLDKTGPGEQGVPLVSVKQETMACKLCNKVYRCRKSLKFHMMCHSGEKPYKCKSCSNRYSTPSALSRHTRERHTGAVGVGAGSGGGNPLRPFCCNRCETSFLLKEDLLAHYEKCSH